MGAEPDFITQSRQAASTRRSKGPGRGAGIVLGVATVAMGLIAGLFFDWTVAVMPALAQADDRTFIVVLQETTTTMVSSPLFVLTFIGAFVITGLAAVLLRLSGARAASRWVLSALVLYGVAVLITMGVHMPLNDTVVSAGDPDKITDLAALREDVEAAWVNAHVGRTLSSTAAMACLCRGLWLRREEGTSTSRRR